MERERDRGKETHEETEKGRQIRMQRGREGDDTGKQTDRGDREEGKRQTDAETERDGVRGTEKGGRGEAHLGRRGSCESR